MLEWASKIRVSVDLRPAFFMFYQRGVFHDKYRDA
jgi:hypothetical protein